MKLPILFLAASYCLATAAPAQGQAVPAKPQPQAECALGDPNAQPLTREQGAAILTELTTIGDELKALDAPGARNRPPMPTEPTTARVPLDPTWQAMGSASAPVVVIEFTDLQCPFCRAFATETFPQIKRDYIDTGVIRFVTRDLPLSIHPDAEDAAEAGRCAGAQGKFWPFREAVLAEAGPPTPAALAGQAARLGLDLAAYQECTADHKFAAAVQSDAATARALGIRGTPAFFIGRRAGPQEAVSASILAGRWITGNRPFEEFKAAIEAAVGPTAAPPPAHN